MFFLFSLSAVSLLFQSSCCLAAALYLCYVSVFVVTYHLFFTFLVMDFFFFFKQKTEYEMRISDWSSDVCSSDLGKRIVVTAGPTHEPIDPVRYIANRSSGKQGFAIAQALAALGADVTLVAGPVALPTPAGVRRVDVETAREMAAAVDDLLPADAAVMVAAVADWRAEPSATKIKKRTDGVPPPLALAENPDILGQIAAGPKRPGLVVGFAAETNDVIATATAKRTRKGCDWLVAKHD